MKPPHSDEGGLLNESPISPSSLRSRALSWALLTPFQMVTFTKGSRGHMSGTRAGCIWKPPIAFLHCVLPKPFPKFLLPLHENLLVPRLTPFRAPPSSSGYLGALSDHTYSLGEIQASPPGILFRPQKPKAGTSHAHPSFWMPPTTVLILFLSMSISTADCSFWWAGTSPSHSSISPLHPAHRK